MAKWGLNMFVVILALYTHSRQHPHRPVLLNVLIHQKYACSKSNMTSIEIPAALSEMTEQIDNYFARTHTQLRRICKNNDVRIFCLAFLKRN